MHQLTNISGTICSIFWFWWYQIRQDFFMFTRCSSSLEIVRIFRIGLLEQHWWAIRICVFLEKEEIPKKYTDEHPCFIANLDRPLEWLNPCIGHVSIKIGLGGPRGWRIWGSLEPFFEFLVLWLPNDYTEDTLATKPLCCTHPSNRYIFRFSIAPLARKYMPFGISIECFILRGLDLDGPRWSSIC